LNPRTRAATVKEAADCKQKKNSRYSSVLVCLSLGRLFLSLSLLFLCVTNLLRASASNLRALESHYRFGFEVFPPNTLWRACRHSSVGVVVKKGRSLLFPNNMNASAATFHTAHCRFEANLERVASSINGFLMTMREESNRPDADIDPVLLSFQRLVDWEAKRSDYLSLIEELIRYSCKLESQLKHERARVEHERRAYKEHYQEFSEGEEQ